MILKSNEIVFRGHPDKVCDQISDYLLDKYLSIDKNSRCAIEVAGSKNNIFVFGEVTSTAKIDIEKEVNYVLKDIGYTKKYNIINDINVQSSDISLGVDKGGAGDQGIMIGYATNDNDKYLPTSMIILSELSKFYDKLVHKDNRFKPDGKAQITAYYTDDMKLLSIKDFTISYQNTEKERKETDKILIDFCKKECKKYNIKIERFLINPTGRFEIGGFDGDSGLTGRKIVVDSYHSFCSVGGGAFSGKDPTKVDRSGAYKAREIAIEYLKKYNLRWCQVELSYAIGIKEPLSIYIRSNIGNININNKLYTECIPGNIIKDLKLKETSYYERAKYGHFV